MLSAPADPPSTIEVTPSRSSVAGVSSGVRDVHVHIDQARRDQLAARVDDVGRQIGAAMFGSIAAIRPAAIATSAARSTRRAGSMTRPPLTMRS